MAKRISCFWTVEVPETSEEQDIVNQGDIEGDIASFTDDYDLILIEDNLFLGFLTYPAWRFQKYLKLKVGTFTLPFKHFWVLEAKSMQN